MTLPVASPGRQGGAQWLSATYRVGFVTMLGVPPKYDGNRRELDIQAINAMENLLARGHGKELIEPVSRYSLTAPLAIAPRSQIRVALVWLLKAYRLAQISSARYR